MLYSTAFKYIHENHKAIKQFQSKSSVMIWGAVSNNRKLPLTFIDKEVKINASYYKQDILTTHLLPYDQWL